MRQLAVADIGGIPHEGVARHDVLLILGDVQLAVAVGYLRHEPVIKPTYINAGAVRQKLPAPVIF